MAFTRVPLWLPPPFHPTNSAAFTSSTIDATGEKVALMGRVWNTDGTTKSITKVWFRFGTVTKAGGSALTVSLQNVDLANGAPHQPDGTQDQTVAIANADAGFVTNGYYQTAAFSASRSVAYGELVAVVIEYDGAGRLGADTVGVQSFNTAYNGGDAGVSLFTASWAAVGVIPNVLFEFTDGSFGSFEWAVAAASTTSTAYNSGSTPDEHALQFTVPWACKCDGAWGVFNAAAATSNFDVVLYEGTTALATISVDGNQVSANNTIRLLRVNFPEVTLATATTYYLSFKPTTVNNFTLVDLSVSHVDHWQAHQAPLDWQYNTRTDAGAWGSPDPLKRPFAGLRFSAIDFPAGASGLLTHPGMNGGMI